MENILKRKLNMRSGHRFALVIIIILAAFAVYLKMQNNEIKQTLQNSYSRSFYELTEYLDNVETLLAKAQISNTPEYSAKTLTEIWREANLAESCLAQIPLSNELQGNSLKFLNQVSDYSYSLSRKTIDNESLSDEDFENLDTLYNNCKNVNETLRNISSSIFSGDIDFR